MTTLPASPARSHSLRSQLLKALATPLFALVLASGIIAYWVATHYTNELFDRSLYEEAYHLSQRLKLGENRAGADLSQLLNPINDDLNTSLVYWRVEGPSGLIAGDEAWLGFGSGHQRYRDARFYYAWHNGKQVRAVQLPVTIDSPIAQAQTYTIEIAERLDKRQHAAQQILLSVSIPLFILLSLGGILISVVLKRELVPLKALTDALNHQSAKSLEDLHEDQVPAEIRPLTHAMNALLGRLREALDAQRKFIADAAHQLRTPLTALKLNADRAAQAQDFAQVQPAINELQTAANRAIRLSNQLLSLARAEPGALQAEFKPLNLAQLVFEVGAEWVPRALENKIDLGLVSPPDDMLESLCIQGQSVLLREALSNLIDNALKYVPKAHPLGGGQITLYTLVEAPAQRPAEAVVIVEDNGPGIPLAQREEVFRRFFRTDYQGVGGAGLGLAIVRDIIQLHHGSIVIDDKPHAEHEAAPQGMRFVMRFPLAPMLV